MTAPRKKELIPTHLGRYEVRAKIADGGMATIYLGRDPGDGSAAASVVALKVIKDEYCLNRDFVNMFLDEAKIIANLSHPNVVQLHELGSEGNRLFIAMELLTGQSLWSVWEACRERQIRLRYDLAAWIGARVAEGLHHAHGLKDEAGAPLNIVHRDVNASNVFITYDGQVKVIDFGLAKATNRLSRTAAGIVKGKLAYMSPEQTVGKPLDCRTDIFALGTTLWEITVDRRLFKGKDDVETLTAVHNAKVPDPTKLVADYPPKLWSVIHRALERDREKRYPTALEFAQELDSCTGIEGREINAGSLAAVMKSLFEFEHERQAAWLTEASTGDAPRHMATLRPPGPSSQASGVGGERSEPPADMFAPAQAPPAEEAPPPRTSSAGSPAIPADPEPARRSSPVDSEPPPSLGMNVVAGGAALVLALAALIAAILWRP